MRFPVALTVLGVAALLAVLSGCAAKRLEPAVFTPAPHVYWEDLSTQPIEPAYNGYRLLAQGPTRGCFPASIGVSRLAIRATSGDPIEREPFIAPKPRNEFLMWNRAFDNQMAVSEAFPVWQRDLGGAQAEPAQIIAAFRALGARVALVYAQNEFSETEAEMLGVLYDAEAELPLATVHARAHSVVPPAEGQARDDACPWDTDARALVRAKFERLTLECVRALILNDEAEVVEVPAGWKPAEPTRPIVWPPRRNLPTG